MKKKLIALLVVAVLSFLMSAAFAEVFEDEALLQTLVKKFQVTIAKYGDDETRALNNRYLKKQKLTNEEKAELLSNIEGAIRDCAKEGKDEACLDYQVNLLFNEIKETPLEQERFFSVVDDDTRQLIVKMTVLKKKLTLEEKVRLLKGYWETMGKVNLKINEEHTPERLAQKKAEGVKRASWTGYGEPYGCATIEQYEELYKLIAKYNSLEGDSIRAYVQTLGDDRKRNIVVDLRGVEIKVLKRTGDNTPMLIKIVNVTDYRGNLFYRLISPSGEFWVHPRSIELE